MFTRALATGGVLIATALFAGCGTSSLAAGPPPSTSAITYPLINAEYSECANAGQQLARYLATGQPPQLDANFGNERVAILGLQNDQRPTAIDGYADNEITACDQQADADATAAASASAALASKAQLTRLVAAAKAPCAAAGGGTVDANYSPPECSTYVVMSLDGNAGDVMFTINRDGSLQPLNSTDYADRAQCLSGNYESHDAGNGPGRWDAALNACFPRG